LTRAGHEHILAAMSKPDLSAVFVAGPLRERAQRSLNHLGAQTAAARMEILVMDLSADGTPPLVAPPGVQVDIVRRPGLEHWSWARAEAVRRAQSPVVAYIEDHCYAAPGWAENLLDAYQGPWAAIGYGFTNANPRTYIARSSLTMSYSQWLHPRSSGRTRWLPGQNVSYRREMLLSFRDRMTRLLTPDYGIQELIAARGLPLYVESRALAAHENFEHLTQQVRANFAFARLLAARRAETKEFTVLKRTLYSLAVLPGAPFINVGRLIRTALVHPELAGAMLAALPVCTATYLISAIGESLGYLKGEGSAESDVQYWETVSERMP
jgi:Glycosyl transferase family 2